MMHELFNTQLNSVDWFLLNTSRVPTLLAKAAIESTGNTSIRRLRAAPGAASGYPWDPWEWDNHAAFPADARSVWGSALNIHTQTDCYAAHTAGFGVYDIKALDILGAGGYVFVPSILDKSEPATHRVSLMRAVLAGVVRTYVSQNRTAPSQMQNLVEYLGMEVGDQGTIQCLLEQHSLS